MSWTNYLVLESHKLAFELDRQASYYDVNEATIEGKILENLIEANDSDVPDCPLKEITLENLHQILKVYFEAFNFDYDTLNKLFIYWFTANGHTVSIMREEEFVKIRGDYTVINRIFKEG